jgi:alpha-L-rhamnosidase
LEILNLTTDYKTNPLGIVTPIPRLSWEMVSPERNTMQVAYHIKSALGIHDLNANANLLWDSKKVTSDQSNLVEYAGPALTTGELVFWQVKVWDNKGNESEWSLPASWEMGLLSTADWKAAWLEPGVKEDVSVSTPSPLVRKEFKLGKEIKAARIYASAHGLYQIHINGKKVGDELFTPGWTSYQKRLQYQVYDVTKQVVTGQNAIGVILGDGWYRGFLTWDGNKNHYGENTALLLQMEITYQDGSKELIVSDNSWKSSTGPILKSDIYNGETYDARLEKNGWDKPGYQDNHWDGVVLKNHDKEILVASDGVPVRITETIKPIEKIITPKGELVFDLGQNIVGWVRLSLKGSAGDKITLNHAEVLDKEGNFYIENLRVAKAEDQYIFKGDGVETYEPSFTFHGFRYIKVTGYPHEISLNDIAGRVVHSDMKPIGDFECSDEQVNRLQKNIQWGLRGNFLDVPTDCPQRDERLGWTGDAQVFAPTACFNMNADSFYTKWMKDFTADQRKNGSVPWVVPMVVEGGGGTGWSDGYGATGWADAAVIIPWVVYQAYGDKRIIENQYGSMKAWIDYMKKESGNSYLFNTGFHFGDWLAFAEYYSYKYNAPDYGYPGAYTEKDLIATAYFYYSAGLLEKSATLLGKDQDAKEMKQLRVKIKEAFQKEFVTSTGRLTSGSQTAYILALTFDIMPDDMRKIAAKRLADDVTHFGHLTTGFLGTPLICQALSDNGYPDIAFQLLFNKRYPSWLYPVTMGATTIWERWDCIKPDGSFQDAGMNSFNHYAYGAVGNWLYSRVAGLSIDPDQPGYKKMIIHPSITKELSYATAKHHSVYGDIESGWKTEGNKIQLHIVVPANTTARVHFPISSEKLIFEGGKAIVDDKNIKFIGSEKGRVIFEIGSGDYLFDGIA